MLIRLVKLFILLSITTCAIANPWEDQPTPIQQYKHAIEGSNKVENVEKNVLAAKPKSDEAQEQQIPIKEEGSKKLLQDQINQLNQNNILFAQSVNNKLNKVNTHITNLQQEVKQLDQALLLLNKQLTQLKKQTSQTALQPPTETSMPAHAQGKQHAKSALSWLQNMTQQIGPIAVYSLLAVIVLLIGLVIYLILQRKSKQNHAATFAEETDDTSDEYDYMGSEESIPAKLNLARAYIAMEDFVSAKKMVAEILMHGDDEQCREADGLMKQIPQK